MLQAVRLRDFAGGYNLRDAPLKLQANDLLALENMYALPGGSLIGRGGQTEYNASAIDANPIKSLYRFYKQSGAAKLIATSGTKVYTGNDGTGVFTEIDSGYTAGLRFGFTSWSAKDAVYWINGGSGVGDVLKKYDATTVSTVAGSPPQGIGPAFYADRLWILTDNLAYFSDLNVDNVWNAAAALNVTDSKNGTRSFIHGLNRVLVAGKTTGLWRFEGSPLLGGSLEQYSEIGCIAPASARVVTAEIQGEVVPIGVIYLGRDGVYMTDGYTSRRISQKIDTIFTDHFRGAVGGYNRKRQQYWLSFNAAGGTNDTTWVATKIDQPGGSFLSWSLYTGFKIDSFAMWDGAGDKGEFYAGRSDTGKVRRLDIGAQDLGADYTCKFTTRNLDFGDPGVNKTVRWLKAVFAATRTVGWTISYLVDGQLSSDLEAVTPSSAEFDTGEWDTVEWAGSPDRNTRTSTLFSGEGRYLNLSMQNTGDGPNFRVDEVLLDATTRDRRKFDLFSLYQGG